MKKVTTFSVILGMCAFIAASSATLLACNSNTQTSEPSISQNTASYIDMPEELPSAGDILQVLDRRNDTIFMGYVSPDRTIVSFNDLRHYPAGTLVKIDSVCSDSIAHLSIFTTE